MFVITTFIILRIIIIVVIALFLFSFFFHLYFHMFKWFLFFECFYAWRKLQKCAGTRPTHWPQKSPLRSIPNSSDGLPKDNTEGESCQRDVKVSTQLLDVDLCFCWITNNTTCCLDVQVPLCLCMSLDVSFLCFITPTHRDVSCMQHATGPAPRLRLERHWLEWPDVKILADSWGARPLQVGRHLPSQRDSTPSPHLTATLNVPHKTMRAASPKKRRFFWTGHDRRQSPVHATKALHATETRGQASPAALNYLSYFWFFWTIVTFFVIFHFFENIWIFELFMLLDNK